MVKIDDEKVEDLLKTWKEVEAKQKAEREQSQFL